MTDSCRYRRAIDRHFGGTIPPAAERALRAHLSGCTPCDAYYRRHLLLEAMTPRSLGAQRRIARGLGMASAPRTRWTFPIAAIAAFVAVLGLIALRSDGGTPSTMTARGGRPTSALVAYLIRGDDHAELRHAMSPADELSFAYRNLATKPYLLVFGVDDTHRVYWYYPAWSDPARAPSAVAISASTELIELPEAIRHDIAGKSLAIYAAFVTRPWTTVEVEARAASVPFGAPIVLEARVDPAYSVAVQR
jgi:hypothetical protein